MTPMQTALTLRTRRERQGVTRQQIADYVKVSPTTICRWENNGFPEYGEKRFLQYFEGLKAGKRTVNNVRGGYVS